MLTKLVKTRLYMVAVLGLFIGPLLLAMLLVWGPESWRPAGMANHGTLINPPQPFNSVGLQAEDGSAIELGDKWTLLVINQSAQCAEACRQALYDTRQIRLAMGKDTWRVERLYISTERVTPTLRKFLKEQHPELSLAQANPGWHARTNPQLENVFESGRIYLVDSHGLLMMYFPAGLPAKGILKDLQRLVKVA